MLSVSKSNFLSSVECASLLELPPVWNRLGLVGAEDVIGYSSQRVAYGCVLGYRDVIGEILLPKLKQFDIVSLPSTFNYAKYEVGGVFKDHKDRMPGVESIKDRLITAVIQLNEGYEGGSLIVRGQQVEKGLGTIALFDSGLTHSVTEVTKGVRYSLTMWFTKDNLKPNVNVL